MARYSQRLFSICGSRQTIRCRWEIRSSHKSGSRGTLAKETCTGLRSQPRQSLTVRRFSAAVPFQGGVHHVNEQWPEFWQGLFAERGYKSLDLIRKEFWKNAGVKYWYRQNMFLFAREDVIPANPKLLEAASDADDLMLVQRSILHYQMGVRSIVKQLRMSIWSAASRRLKRVLK